METACKKNKDTRQTKNLITIYINSSYPFIIDKFLCFSFPCLKQCNPVEDFSTTKKMLYLGIFELRFEKPIGIFEINALKLV